MCSSVYIQQGDHYDLAVGALIRTHKYGARRFSYAAATLRNAISDDGLKNSKHV